MTEEMCETFIADCHVRAGVELISHTWDPLVLSALRTGPVRRSDLLNRMGGASDKVLTESLRRLSARGLVARRKGDGGRATAYELTNLGESFANGPLKGLAEWAADNQAAFATTT